jgi:hypothetical protein
VYEVSFNRVGVRSFDVMMMMMSTRDLRDREIEKETRKRGEILTELAGFREERENLQAGIDVHL